MGSTMSNEAFVIIGMFISLTPWFTSFLYYKRVKHYKKRVQHWIHKYNVLEEKYKELCNER